jgi:uncharacterized protein (TIGR00730 family)
MSRETITIFGSGKSGPGDQAYITAYEIGRLLAQSGFTIANGGYGGTMTAAAKGAAEAGGEVIGVTCSAFKQSCPNKYITREIVTGSLQERLNKLTELGAGYIALPGGTGTLLELAHVWELKNKGFLNHQKPLIIIGGFWRPLLEIIAADEPNRLEHVQQAGTPSDAVRLLCNIMKPAAGGKEES